MEERETERDRETETDTETHKQTGQIGNDPYTGVREEQCVSVLC